MSLHLRFIVPAMRLGNICFLCVFFGEARKCVWDEKRRDEQIASNGTKESVSISTGFAIMTQTGLIPVYPRPWFKFSSNGGNAFWGWTQIKLFRCVCVWKCVSLLIVLRTIVKGPCVPEKWEWIGAVALADSILIACNWNRLRINILCVWVGNPQ